MDTRKITLIATIAVIALIAVGVRYAYTASTLNDNNNAQSEYITLTQGEEGKYKFATNEKVYYNSVNTALNSTTYSLADNTMQLQIGADTYATVVKVGEVFTIDANEVNGDHSKLVCSFATSGFQIYNTFWKLYMKVVVNDSTSVFFLTAADVWDDYQGADNQKFDINYNTSDYYLAYVTFYYGYDGTTPYTGSSAPPETVLDSASITFTVERTGQNYVGTNFDVKFNKPNTLVYNGTNQAPTVTVNYPDGTPVAEDNRTITLSNSGTWTNAGEYTVTVTGKGALTQFGSETFKFTIEKANSSISVNEGQIFTTAEYTPAVTKTGSGGAVTFTYYSDSAGQTSIDKPSANGTYYVKATVAADSNYEQAVSSIVSFKIEITPGP